MDVTPLQQPAGNIALLAPVPLHHLQDGYQVARQQGKVAFGSMKWELFRELDVA